MGKYLSTQKSTRKLRKNWNQFVLIATNPVTSNSFEIRRFISFSELQEELPHLLNQSSLAGEWNYILYQVPENFKLIHKYGFDGYPKPHKHIMTYSYHHLTPESVEVSPYGITLMINPDDSNNWEKNLMVRFVS